MSSSRSSRRYESEKYLCTPDTVNQTLEQYGVAVIPSVLSSEECSAMIAGMWDFLEHITSAFETPIHRDKPETWRQFRKLFPKHSMLLQHFGIGQSDMNWQLRQNPKLTGIFATIWDTKSEDLLVSFDGASFHFPPETVGYGWHRPGGEGWLHCDQSFKNSDKQCIQSWVTANDVEEGGTPNSPNNWATAHRPTIGTS